MDELVAGLPPGEQRTELSRMLWVVDERSYHICVSVFHEHPSLLPEEERRKWRRVDERLGERLAAALRASTGALAPPTLQLDSLSITADGAFIAGFVDDAHGAFAALRAAAGRCGEETIGGELTSRPKALIHVTLGRLLGVPAALSDEQRERIAHLVRRHNAHVLPARVARAPHALTMHSLSLARDQVWWMTEYSLLDTWPLDGSWGTPRGTST